LTCARYRIGIGYIELFCGSYASAPHSIALFHGYYDRYCYLPLYIFCDRHLLAAKLRRSNAPMCRDGRN
jgi:hypothetical protein